MGEGKYSAYLGERLNRK